MVGGVPRLGLDGGGGTPVRFGWWGGYPGQVWMVGVPQPGLDGGGVPRLGLDGGGGTPVRSGWWGGYPARSGWWGEGTLARSGWYPRYPPPPPLDSSIASTCYAASGMPLAFTQEDFLVYYKVRCIILQIYGWCL